MATTFANFLTLILLRRGLRVNALKRKVNAIALNRHATIPFPQ